jgi:predicted patatin/cPLA2 family phospholipase
MAGEDGKCRALVLAGGGDKGAYQAAVIKTLVDNLPPVEVTWDVVTGVSAGTLNGAAVAAFAPGDEKAMVDFMYTLWEEVETKNVLKWWPGGIASGLTIAPSLFNNNPLRNFLQEQIGDKTVRRHFKVGTCDANTAEYVVYDYEPTPELPEDLIETLIASAAIDGIFPPVIRGERTLVDGGSIWNSNIIGAVDSCRDLGYADEDIIVDYILCAAKEIDVKEEEIEDYHTIKHALNAWSIRSYYSGMGDVERTIIFYPEVNFRYTIVPSQKLSSGPIPLDFSAEHKAFTMAVGHQDAEAALKLGPGGYHSLAVENFRANELGETDVSLGEVLKAAMQ